MSKLKNICYIMLALLVLAPSIVKLGHHHEEFHCSAKNEKHFHNYHPNCEICQFDFSVFKAEDTYLTTKHDLPKDCYKNCYSSLPLKNTTQFSFQLRAPPFSDFKI